LLLSRDEQAKFVEIYEGLISMRLTWPDRKSGCLFCYMVAVSPQAVRLTANNIR
jgi:hypothetical protein